MEKNDILIIHGTRYKDMTKELLEAAKLDELIGDKKKKIGLKPNLVCGNAPSTGATTHAELLEGVIEYLQARDFRNITIMEGSWVGDRTSYAYRVAGYDQVCAKYNVPFVDLQKDSFSEYDCKGMRINICDQAAAVDFMINMPVLKGHCQTVVTCALKNNKGTIPNQEKRKFHTMGLHKPIAHLNTVARNDFILVDNICGDLDFEEGGNPVTMNRILGFRDPVLCDAYVCDSMGHTLDEVPYIRMAEKLGVGSADTSKANIVMLNKDRSKAKFRMSRRVANLAQYTEPKDACSACYGSLIHALDRLNDTRSIPRNGAKICIGQGYQGKTDGAIGVGRCTSGCALSLKGCPPKAIDMVKFLEENWGKTR